MKLVFAVVNDKDGDKVMEKLNKKGLSVTKLNSSGGFLRTGNTTLMVGVEKENLEEVLEIIEINSRSRKQVLNAPVTPVDASNIFMTKTIEVTVGGATIFVVDVEEFKKV